VPTNYPQYGIYLIPSPSIWYQIAVAHHVFSSEFKAHTAGRFMVHCTVKGFFKLKENTSITELIAALNDLFSRTKAIPTQLEQLIPLNRPIFSPSFFIKLKNTPEFQKLHEEVWDIVRPYIAPDCLFSPVEPVGSMFIPHITLGMQDLPEEPGLFHQFQALAECAYETFSKEPFNASAIQLIEFYSNDWAAENWGKTLDFKLLQGWNLE